MERDLNGQMIPDAFEVAGRRMALEMAAMAQRALDLKLIEKTVINPEDVATHKPKVQWTRKDGTTGQREAWRRELTGYQTGQKEKAKAREKRARNNGTAPSGAPTGDAKAPVNAGTAAALQGDPGHRLNGHDDASPLREVEGAGGQSQPSANPRGQSCRPTPIHTEAAD